jgi:hypothetical protein
LFDFGYKGTAFLVNELFTIKNGKWRLRFAALYTNIKKRKKNKMHHQKK